MARTSSRSFADPRAPSSCAMRSITACATEQPGAGAFVEPGGTRGPSSERRRGTLGTVTVPVSDPHPGMRAALTAALDAQAGIAVVGSANRLEDAVAAIRRHRPDVVLVDLAVLNARGIAGLGELAAVRRSTGVLV